MNSSSPKLLLENVPWLRFANQNTCVGAANTAQATAEDKQEWQTGKRKKFEKTMVAKTRAEPIRQLTGHESMHGKLATLPDVRLVYHESGRRKLLAKYQTDAP